MVKNNDLEYVEYNFLKVCTKLKSLSDGTITLTNNVDGMDQHRKPEFRSKLIKPVFTTKLKPSGLAVRT